MNRWHPPRTWHAYPVPGGYREYRHGWLGYSWAVIPAARMAGLYPRIAGRALPDPARGGIIPDEAPEYYGVRLDCRGRLDRLLGSGTAGSAREACERDAGRIAQDEARHFARAGRRPAWAAAPGDRAESPPVIRRDRITRPLRRLADMTARTRKARMPAALLQR